jgi:hypothetical protein
LRTSLDAAENPYKKRSPEYNSGDRFFILDILERLILKYVLT